MRHLKTILLSVLVLLLTITSCKEQGGNNDVILSKEEVPYDHTGQFVTVISSTGWKAEVKCGTGEKWCDIVPNSGKGNCDNVMLSYKKNNSEQARTVSIVFTFSDGSVIIKDMTQLGKPSSGNKPDKPVDPDYHGLVSDEVHEWMELPSVSVEQGHAYIYHIADAGGKSVRNYSMYYDAENRIALWVAYPLCKDYRGHQGRTDAWAYDDKIPAEYQPLLHHGWPHWNGNRYDRGHQLPSGSRTASRDMNVQTFYYTNMTAQISGFNQGLWMHTEGLVRDYMGGCDTLYVVTGPVISTKEDPEIDYIEDNVGNLVAIPKAYFKVLLRYNKSDDSYKSIGFWFENRDYDRKQPDSSDIHSVSEIEKWTGWDFFDNLPDDIEDDIKNQFEPSKWGF